jgi:hypothetical protein
MSVTQINEVLLAPLTNARVAITDPLGHLTQSITTATEVSYVNGVTQALQPVLNAIESGAATANAAAAAASTAASNAQATANNAQITANNAIPNSAGAVTSTNLATGSVTSGKIAAGVVRGSSANSGGSQQEVSQGTISTPDLRANAVTNPQSSSSDTIGSLATRNLVTSKTITTLGGPVLVLASCAQFISSVSNSLDFEIAAMRGSTAIPGGSSHAGISFTGSYSAEMSLTVCVIDTPPAGTYTYNLYSFVFSGSGGAIINQSLVVVELRA